MKLFRISLYLVASLFIFGCNAKKGTIQETEETVTNEAPPNADSNRSSIDKDDEKFNQAFLLKLKNLKGITAKVIPTQNSFYKYMYELQVEQPVDHTNPKSETFTQKVYLSHLDFNKPMVMYLNGYTASNNAYITEAASMLGSNQIHVEHRFFSQSRPETIPWKLLTIEQSAADHHRIVELLKKLYTKPWVSTGISKGGMVTMFHKKFYPNDVAVAMPYVAPLNLERHDPRVYEHLKTVGTEECREKIIDYQRSLLIHYDEALQYFVEYSKKAGYNYPHGEEASFELSVFEFSFAFWQWSGDCSIIPEKDSSVEDKVKFLFYTIDAPSFFNESTLTNILPFFYQGYYEIGMYGYEISKFTDLTKVYKEEEVDNFYTFIPEGMEVEYNRKPVLEVKNWLDKNGNNMIYVYGDLDPWGATAYKPTAATNSIFMNLPNGNHSTRMMNFPKEERTAAINQLKKWIQEAE